MKDLWLCKQDDKYKSHQHSKQRIYILVVQHQVVSNLRHITHLNTKKSRQKILIFSFLGGWKISSTFWHVVFKFVCRHAEWSGSIRIFNARLHWDTRRSEEIGGVQAAAAPIFCYFLKDSSVCLLLRYKGHIGSLPVSLLHTLLLLKCIQKTDPSRAPLSKKWGRL